MKEGTPERLSLAIGLLLQRSSLDAQEQKAQMRFRTACGGMQFKKCSEEGGVRIYSSHVVGGGGVRSRWRSLKELQNLADILEPLTDKACNGGR